MNRWWRIPLAGLAVFALAVLGLTVAAVVEAFEARDEAILRERRVEGLALDAIGRRDQQIDALLSDQTAVLRTNGELVGAVNALREQVVDLGGEPVVERVEVTRVVREPAGEPESRESEPSDTEPSDTEPDESEPTEPEPEATTTTEPRDRGRGEKKGHDR